MISRFATTSPHPFQHGSQTLLYTVDPKEGHAVGELLDPPKKDQNWRQPKKGMWCDHQELLVPLDSQEKTQH